MNITGFDMVVNITYTAFTRGLSIDYVHYKGWEMLNRGVTRGWWVE